MAAAWFYQSDGKLCGPLPAQELRLLADWGGITPDTLVRKGGDGDWVPARLIRGLFSQDNSSPPLHPVVATPPGVVS